MKRAPRKNLRGITRENKCGSISLPPWSSGALRLLLYLRIILYIVRMLIEYALSIIIYMRRKVEQADRCMRKKKQYYEILLVSFSVVYR